jgi:hypothetical protein
MKRVVVRVVTAAFVAGSAAIGFAPIAAAATESTLSPSTEAWYQPNPTCLTPAGCVTTSSLPAAPPAQPPAASPYPAGTLHVGVTLGQEDARSYLGFPLSDLAGQTVTAGTLTVPLDVTQADGSTSPDTSKVIVCVTSGPVTATEGTTDTPPTTDCKTAVPAKYVATPQPHLTADLTALAGKLPSATGLALVPDASKAAPSDNWRVVFSAHTRTDAAKTAPASLTLTVEDAAPYVDVPVDQPINQQPYVSAVTPVTGTGFAPPPAQNPTVSTPETPTLSLPAAPASSPRMVTVGYAYPAVWLLPLAFLILVPATARALTKDLTPA